VGLSGGVDSAVAVLLLQRQGYNVIGLHLDIGMEDGRMNLPRLAEVLGIKIYVRSLRRLFQKDIVDYFVRQYVQGKTPNPCLLCNRKIKFAFLIKEACNYRCHFIATGHYANIVYNRRQGRFFIKRHPSFYDQSYFLYSLRPAWLKKIKFPLATLDKKQVLALAKSYGLLPFLRLHPTQDICFIKNDYRQFLKEKVPQLIRPGRILYYNGEVLGEHPSHLFYTIGQRQNLGISWPQPLYVLKKQPADNTLIVGEKEKLAKKELVLSQLNLFTQPLPFKAKVSIRYRSQPQEAFLERVGLRLRVVFVCPQTAIAPGQAGVIYWRNMVLGGGIIN